MSERIRKRCLGSARVVSQVDKTTCDQLLLWGTNHSRVIILCVTTCWVPTRSWMGWTWTRGTLYLTISNLGTWKRWLLKPQRVWENKGWETPDIIRAKTKIYCRDHWYTNCDQQLAHIIPGEAAVPSLLTYCQFLMMSHRRTHSWSTTLPVVNYPRSARLHVFCVTRGQSCTSLCQFVC